MNMHILSPINRKVSRWVVGVLLSVLCVKGGGGGDYFRIYSLYDIHIIFSYDFVLILSGLKYSAGLVPFIVHHVINIYIYMYVYTFAEYFISEILLNPLLLDQVVAHPINYPRES